MATQLPDKMTPLTPEEATQALSEGYKLVTGRKPSKNILALLIGQSALETGNWKMMHNYNMGNAKKSGSDEYYQVYLTGDDPTDPGAHYAAHLTAADGAAHFIRVLKKRENWWNGLQTGDPMKFAEGLAMRPFAYYTADPSHYAKILVDRYKAYMPLAAKYGGSILGTVLGLLFVGGTAYLGYKRIHG
jgi:hypothetical protein